MSAAMDAISAFYAGTWIEAALAVGSHRDTARMAEHHAQARRLAAEILDPETRRTIEEQVECAIRAHVRCLAVITPPPVAS